MLEEISDKAKGISKRRKKIHSKVHSLFFRESLGVMVIDEAHEVRTGGKAFNGIIHLRDKCLSVIALTATPLYTGARVRVSSVVFLVKDPPQRPN